MVFQKFEYKIKDGKACIEGCFSSGTIAEIPEMLDECPVVEIAPYAFSASSELKSSEMDLPRLSGERLEEIILPKTVQKIGRYAFYNCKNLQKISFYNVMTDLGAGAFTGCHKVKELDVTFLENRQSILREFLMELPEDQMVALHYEDEYANVLFPEFFEESVENTPARILEIHTHGSGMLYRNCFVKKELNFQMYDEKFAEAIGREFSETLFQLAFQRLLNPYQLSEKAKKKYIFFLEGNLQKCALWAVENEKEDEIRFLAENCGSQAQQLDVIIEAAGRKNHPAILSYLMDKKHQKFKVKRKTFEL